MSEPDSSRARKFDGFDRPKSTPAVPEGGLDRIVEALYRTRNYLSKSAAEKLADLWNSDTALALGVLLAVWAGLQFTPVGWLADVLLAAAGLLSMISDFVELVKAARQAAAAETDGALNEAAQAMAAAITDSIADGIAALIGSWAFARLRRLTRVIRSRLLPRRFGSGTEQRLTLGERTPPAIGKATVADKLIGANTGVGLAVASVELGKAKKEADHLGNGLGWGLAIVGGVVLVGSAVALTHSSAESR